MNISKNQFTQLKGSEGLLPQEETLEQSRHHKSLIIGVPCEKPFYEKRVALVPSTVKLLVQHGHQVILETGAGQAAFFSDMEYSDAGARVVYDRESVFKAQLIIKVAPPTEADIELMQYRQTIISSLNISGLNAEFLKKMMAKKITAIAYEYIQDKAGTLPLVRAMSEIAGNTSIFVAAEYLSHPDYGKGKVFGGFPGIHPTEVVILGAGTVGEFAARAAMGLGALVKVFDNSLYRLRRLQSNLTARIYTSILQPEVLSKALKSAEVVIGAIRAPQGSTPCMISKEMVSQMKEGAVIIDVSIDQGGCFETSRITSHENPVFSAYGITHYCVPNIPSRVPHTASYALSNYFSPVFIQMGEMGGLINMLRGNLGIRKGVFLFNGTLTNRHLSDRFGLSFQDLELLMAAFS